MSFLAKVLSAAEETEIEHLRRRIPELTTEIANLKSETEHYINSVYSEIKERPQRNNILLKKTSRLCDDMDILHETIEEHIRKTVPNVEKEINDLAGELRETNDTLSVASKMVRIHNGLLTIRELQNQKKLVESLKEIHYITDEVRSFETEEELKEAVNKIKIDLLKEETFVCDTLNIIFGDNVSMDSKDVSGNVVNTIRIEEENDTFKEALAAFYLLNPEIISLNKVSEFVLEHMCKPTIANSVEIEIKEENTAHIITATVITKSELHSYKRIFNELLKIFQFLHSNLNHSLTDNLTSLQYISNEIKATLIELIIKDCLIKTIPSNEEDLKQYDQIFADITNFENILKNYGIFAENESPFTEYTKDIDALYISKKCQEYTEKAITLMRKDLHEMTEVGILHENKLILEDVLEFPKCSISKSILEILNLVEGMLQRAVGSSKTCAVRLWSAVQNILNMYGSVVTEYHQKMIQTIPQQVALFKNNCWYLAHQLDRWNEAYKETLVPLINSQPLLFKDQSHQLRTCGADAFQEYVRGQVRQIDEILQNSDLRLLQSIEKLDANTEKSIRQCLRQQELLKTVWQRVLSYNDYNETLGFIFNSFCNKLVGFVLAAEDIPSDAAEQLVDTFKIVQARGPKLFTDPKEISLYTEVWYRFNEVVFVLSASLAEINDRWADGKGPLALALKPEEVKRLIRALFQNTDRRAAVLARIS